MPRPALDRLQPPAGLHRCRSGGNEMELTARHAERPPGAQIDRELTCTIAGGDLAPRAARRVFDAYVDHLGDRRTREAKLLVSELVGNSVRHACAGRDETIELRVHISPTGITVTVSDHGPGFEPRASLALPAGGVIGGRRLLLVDKTSDHWGVSNDGATHVWFELVA